MVEDDHVIFFRSFYFSSLKDKIWVFIFNYLSQRLYEYFHHLYYLVKYN